MISLSKSKLLTSTYATQLLISLAWYMSIPFIAVYLTVNLAASPAEAGLFVSLGMLSFSLTSPFLGKAIDKNLGKVVLYISGLLLSFSCILFYYSASIFSFYIASILIGLGRAGFGTLVNWSISHLAEGDNKKKAFSMRFTLLNLGAAIGPLISSLFFSDIKSAFLASFCIYTLSFMTLLPARSLYRTEPAQETLVPSTSTSHHKKLVFLLLGLILAGVCYSLITVLFPLSIKQHLDNWEVVYAVMLAINSMMIVFLQLFVTRISLHWGDYKNIILTAALFSLSFVIFAFTTTQWGFYLAMILFTFAELVISPLSYVWIDNIAPKNKKGTYFGIFNLSFLGGAIGPLISGIGIQYFGFTVFYLLLIAVPIMMAFCFFISLYEPGFLSNDGRGAGGHGTAVCVKINADH